MEPQNVPPTPLVTSAPASTPALAAPAAPPANMPETRMSFRLHALSVTVAILAIFVAMARGYVTNGPAATMVGEWIGAMLIGLLAGWIAFFVADRSNLVGNLVFCALVTLAVVAPSITRIGNTAVMRQLQEANTQNLDRLEQRILSSEDFPMTAEWDQSIAKIDGAAKSSSGEQKKVFQAMSEALREARPTLVTYDEESRRATEAGWADVSTISGLGDVKERLRVVQAFRQAAENAKITIKDLPDKVSNKLPRMSHKARQEFSEGFKKGMGGDHIDSIRQEDINLADAVLGMLKLLETEWEHLEIERDNSTVIFESDEAAEKYNKFAEALSIAAERQKELQLKAIQNARERLSQPK